MRHVHTTTARRLKAGLCSIAALALGACATARSPEGAPSTTTTPAVAGQAPPTAPARRTATSPDGTKITYDVEGSGPALLLVHSAGQTGRSWYDRGYVARLCDTFTVITMDLRGSGDSAHPATLGSYALDRMLEDILAVADAAGAPRFHVWGFGHGATLARYLAARSDRVISAVLVGANMGAPLDGVVKEAILGMRAKWLPLVEAQAADTLDLDQLSRGDRAAWDDGIAALALSLSALLDYPPVEPGDLNAPTLWLVGASDTAVQASVTAYSGKLAGTKVTLKSLPGATYSDSFAKIELTLAEAVPFLNAQAPATEP